MKRMHSGYCGIWSGAVLMAGLVFATSPALAAGPRLHSGSGEVMLNSAGECWNAVGGMPGRCAEAPDSDSGVSNDDRDPCPGGAGCAPDADRDGVPDNADQCPDTPYGVRVDAVGCALDLDGDGVPYYRDRCCQQLPPGSEVDTDGCLVKLTLEDVHFDFDRASLRPDARDILNRLADLLTERPDVEHISVSGHADSIGTLDYNQGLSERRARSVKQYLQRRGVRLPISTAGYGETRPVAGNDTSNGRAQNRRVEIELKSLPEETWCRSVRGSRSRHCRVLP